MKNYYGLVKKAEELYEKHELEEASKLYEQAFELGYTIDDLVNAGFLYLELGNNIRAKDLFMDVLKEEENKDAYYGMATALNELGSTNEAIKYYEEAYNVSPENTAISLDLAYAYDKVNNSEKAKEYYLKTLEVDDEDFWAHVNVGSIYEIENNNEEALFHFKKAHAMDSTLPMVSFNLGVVYAKLNQKEKALESYLEELSKEDFYKLTYYNLGVLYKDQFKDYKNARLMYLNSIKRDAKDFSSWYNLGCLYAIMNDYDNAYDCFRYVCYYKKQTLEYMKKDNELDDFRNSVQYQKLLDIIN